MSIARIALAAGWLAAGAAAQPPALTIEQAVTQAVEKYPSVRVSLERVSAAAAGIDLARTAYLPRAELLGQTNRATRNNVFGLLMPQPVVSPISGPVLGKASLTNVWGTAVGVLVSWEPFDFGLRQAAVGAARSERERADAQAGVARLEVAAAAADAFLTTLAAEQTVRAARAGVDRALVWEQAVRALVGAELRPGVDASRAAAELAQARTQLIQTERAEQMSRVALAQLLGVPAATLRLDPEPLLRGPAQLDPPEQAAPAHPRARAQNTVVEAARSRQRVLERSYFPRFALQGTTFSRGSGANPDGTTGGAGAGLGPNFYNWGLGLSVTFPALELPSLRARRRMEAHQQQAEAARYQQVLRELEGDREKARAALVAARRIAEHTPLQLAAARDLERQASARYQAGLATAVETAEAQRLLTQSEIDNALAGLGVWRALLAVEAAGGDLTPLLERTRR